MTETGTLFIVATPIGNLSDITQRALDTLNEVDLIAAEDTRHSGKLLSHFGVKTKMFPLHDHNEKQKSQLLVNKIKEGQNIALISDAGTPLISDPGYNLVNVAREQGVAVVPIPGPSAVITALSAAGLPTDKFMFCGFLPVKQQAKITEIEAHKQAIYTSVFYESPRRILDTLATIQATLGDEREVVLAKELTKHYEAFSKGSCQSIIEWLNEDTDRLQGEMVVMISPNKEEQGLSAEADALLRRLMQDLPLKKAAGITAELHGLKKNDLYKLALSWQDKE
ncbi:16S rRNA (cytidine(1402)-2'-O)-methyltransferase [Psychrosphaera sp. B3R10]|uniref:16S rRNA (cytidine(1402)-2'-O)-methyltransferase n=1 Tax=unclassified Psychrosphaera TaxID=2641570 RepID=UPI001C0A045D|nr:MULTISPECIES: 16S rRNA (cytidine(1402)-2'-O)-methyltransferase [unclassified Psychrosphaera]MBU2882424.1 16S rRNA (cytidine(1402)-2'-O)-methyltransferase [Psychrosphaera sp. I2R16]MBU2990245.1 16S rRNA (cytidine(1402)-2'-O)-methyltransferase [Psychrosphaera sp. B3R10]